MSRMEVQEQITLFVELIESSYKEQLLNRMRKDEKFLLIDFSELVRHSPGLAEDFLDEPEQLIKAAEIAIEQFDTLGDVKNFKARFHKVSKVTLESIWKLRASSLDKFTTIEGYIRRAGDVQHKIVTGKFECPSCGDIVNKLFLDEKYSAPEGHGCGRKGKLRLIDSEKVDVQKIVVEEDPSILKPTQKPRSILVILTNDLTRAEVDETLQPSRKVLVSGIIKDRQIKPYLNECKKFMEANYIEVTEGTLDKMTFTDAEIKEFQKMARSKTLFEDLAQSVTPNIEGHESARQALVLQLIGGTALYIDGQLEERGQIHILLVGSPGSGKSQMLKRSVLFLPGSRFTGGKGASGVGLIAAVTKDEELGGYTLNAGAVPMASGAMCAIDELDKMDKRDIAHLNSAMVDMKVYIDRADIHGMLETNTAILAAGNPKDRVFDTKEVIWKQIGIPKDLMDRFDLIFPVRTPKEEALQRKVAEMVVGKYNKESKIATPKYPKDLMVKYIAYAKKFCEPRMNAAVSKYIVDNFINIVKPVDPHEDAAYFSYRLLTNIIRLTQSISKTRLSNKVMEEDAQRAINLLIDSLKMQEIITPAGLFDYERGEAITPKSKRDIAFAIKGIIRDVSGKSDDSLANYDEMLSKALAMGIEDVDLIDDTIEKLKRIGDVIEVRRNKYKLQ